MNPQYDNRLFVELNTMNNLLSYFGLVDARIRASEKDLPVNEIIDIISFRENGHMKVGVPGIQDPRPVHIC